ncbi:LGFP repeat-containing protein [Amycolatopsis keratiniphila]|uniref:LGFP repeat-containing protein n=1 Tax=Amycolatopsis keratiniphila TaxID=129921 RepID=UPI0003A8FD22|nr:hypothetical protein [Amycolatopsis keratiniphila]
MAAADPVPLEPVSCAGRTDVVRVKSSAGDGRPVCFEIPDDFGEYAIDVPGAYLLAGDNAHPITVTLIDESGTAGAVDIDLGGWTAVGAGKEQTAASALRLISAATARGYAAVTAERQRLIADGFADFYLGEPIMRIHRANPTAAETPDNVGWEQFYEGGAIYYTAATGARAIYGGIFERYFKLGRAAGPLGYPTTSQAGGPTEGWYADFTGNPATGGGNGGSIYWNPENYPFEFSYTRANALYGPIREKWVTLGRTAWQGQPLTDLSPTPTPNATGPNGAGTYVHFGQPTEANYLSPTGPANASIYYSDQTGRAHTVQGSIRQTWRQHGWEQGRFGFPTSDEQTTPTGWTQTFQHGTITWNRGATAPILTTS